MRSAISVAGFAAGLVLVILAAGACSGASPSERRATEQPRQNKSASASSHASPSADGASLGRRALAIGAGVTVELLALDRVSPTAVVARWRVRNDMAEEYAFGASLTVPWNSKDIGSNAIGGVSLLDSASGRWYFPRAYRNGDCQCTRDWPRIEAGQEQELVAVFPAPPADVTRLDVLFPQAPPFLDVPLGQAAPTPLRVDDSGNDPVDPNSARVGDPVVLSIVNQVEQAGVAQDDDGRQVSVRLSSDVLFALNKADLSPSARSTLKAVAAQITRSQDSEVAIDGHTDNTGTDAINEPLSQRRARSVQAALEKLVTRSGVSYHTRGHGSHEPIASNKNAQGRKTNRRVTITFSRPAEPEPAQNKSTATRSPAVPSSATTLPVLATAPAGKAPETVSEEYWARRAEVRINKLTRDAGGYVNLVWTIRNDDDEPVNAWISSYDLGGVYAESSTSGAALVHGPYRYRPLRDAKHHVTLGPYLLRVGQDEYLVEKGEEYTLWAMFKPPADVSAVTVQIPGFEPIADLPIN